MIQKNNININELNKEHPKSSTSFSLSFYKCCYYLSCCCFYPFTKNKNVHNNQIHSEPYYLESNKLSSLSLLFSLSKSVKNSEKNTLKKKTL